MRHQGKSPVTAHLQGKGGREAGVPWGRLLLSLRDQTLPERQVQAVLGRGRTELGGRLAPGGLLGSKLCPKKYLFPVASDTPGVHL